MYFLIVLFLKRSEVLTILVVCFLAPALQTATQHFLACFLNVGPLARALKELSSLLLRDTYLPFLPEGLPEDELFLLFPCGFGEPDLPCPC